MNKDIIVLLCICAVALARPQDKKKTRVFDGKVSEEEHFRGTEQEHNTEYDHEAFLGDEKKTFDQLSPEESKERLGKLVDKIDVDHDGKVTEEELKQWIKKSAKRYVYEDVDRQWDHLKKIEHAKIKMDDLVDGKRVDMAAPIGWEEYKNNTYGFIKEDDKSEYNYDNMIKRDRRRWEKADINRDDKLSKEEYTAFLHPEEYEYMKDVVVEETLDDIDKNKDGYVSLEEYLGDLYPESEKEDEEPDWVKTEREQFLTVRDKNRDGKMDKDEVRDWIVPADFDHVGAEVTHLINEADVNKDGYLTKSEIIDKHEVFAGSQATDFGDALTRHDEF
ncbi:predicted protein [Nematostella vectensis]|uniref:Reticulocalbin-3 n=1 Tax=Nematostella vectensis TaxID=45351 RepID=A7SUH8_NEMVE|nr:calumenin-B [Nematostella vectensis]EDO32638.1 predicted protein [Nematostella vectensis]|eukprot:XP_001624738.1 predicted protein [Nematostella vectensis]